MTTDITVHGTCDARFAPLRDVFVENFSTLGETGASLAIALDGYLAVDIWAGYSDAARTRPWARDTVANVFSTTKGLTAMCAHRLADQGRLDLDAPVARYWPEFAAGGKERLPVRYLLSHQAGMAAVRRPLQPGALYEWDTMTDALAEQEPWWVPGEKHGYHALTYGYLVGEVIRRVSGKSVGTYFRDEIAGPLGADASIGLPASDASRVAPLITPPAPPPEQIEMFMAILNDPEGLLAKAFLNPPLLPDAANTPEWRAAEIPAANGHTNARALAHLYGTLACGGTADGTRLMGPEAIAQAYTQQADGRDAIMPLHTRFGLGFMLSTPSEKMGPSPHAFGHGGMGGSLGFGDPDARLGFGYVMNELHLGLWLIDPRPVALIAALYDCLSHLK